MSSASALRYDAPALRRVVVGTVGHIDHGKTELVKALTGIDCDRWGEEKERGITIDIGFAHLTEGDLQVGFVDVPGHQRFLHNALAGLGGIRIGLLVVAATEGVMPQTREHVAICSLLGIPSVLVALTKVDLVENDLAELAELEIEEFLEGSPYTGAPIFPVSAVTGEGLESFRRGLLDLAARHIIEERPGEPVRFPIDRAFTLRGLGAVVTGTLVSGIIEQGDYLSLLPSGETVRVRNIQIHGEGRPYASAGERTSLQVGGVGLETLRRGLQLVTPRAFQATGRLCARFRLLDESPVKIDEPTEIRFHLYSTEVLGTLRALRPTRLEPGSEGIVEIRLREPVVLARGDRFVVRRPTPAATLGGGRVLDPHWSRPRSQRTPAVLDALSRSREDAIHHWIESAGPRGLTLEELIPRVALSTEHLQTTLTGLVETGLLLEVTPESGEAPRWVSARGFERLVERASRVLERFFEGKRLAVAMPKAHWVAQVLPKLSPRLTEFYLGSIERLGIVRVAGDTVMLPGRQVELSEAELRAVTELSAAMEDGGLSPPDEDDLRKKIGLGSAHAFDSAVEYLLGIGQLLRLANGALVAASAIERLKKTLLDHGTEKLSVQELKALFELTRKWAIPLLEHLDSIGFTRRVGDVRLIARSP